MNAAVQWVLDATNEWKEALEQSCFRMIIDPLFEVRLRHAPCECGRQHTNITTDSVGDSVEIPMMIDPLFDGFQLRVHQCTHGTQDAIARACSHAQGIHSPLR